jgi:hypothetical protein
LPAHPFTGALIGRDACCLVRLKSSIHPSCRMFEHMYGVLNVDKK